MALVERGSTADPQAPAASNAEDVIQAETETLVPKTVTSTAAVKPPRTASDVLKWASLALLIAQNSGVFLVTRYTRVANGRLYLTSVVVLIVELLKMCICLSLLLYEAKGSPRVFANILTKGICLEWRTTLLLAVPAVCYAIQNNLIFVAISNLSAAAAQVIYQLKTLSTAFFTVLLLGRRFRPLQWFSFALLTVGVILVQAQDAKSSSAPTGSSPVLGVISALAAAVLSGFAGVFLEKMFTRGDTSLWLRNVQLALFSIPLQAAAVYQLDRPAIMRRGFFQGFHPSTWLLIALQVAGALLIAFVIKVAGNVLKTFATSVALLVTCGSSMLLFDFKPTAVFGIGVLMTSASIWLYARPDDLINAWSHIRQMRLGEPTPFGSKKHSVNLCGGAATARQR